MSGKFVECAEALGATELSKPAFKMLVSRAYSAAWHTPLTTPRQPKGPLAAALCLAPGHRRCQRHLSLPMLPMPLSTFLTPAVAAAATFQVKQIIAEDPRAKTPSPADLDQAFLLADEDRNGAIDLDEFVNLVGLIKQGHVVGVSGGLFFSGVSRKASFREQLQMARDEASAKKRLSALEVAIPVTVEEGAGDSDGDEAETKRESETEEAEAGIVGSG